VGQPAFFDRVKEQFVLPLYRSPISRGDEPVGAVAEAVARLAQEVTPEELRWMLGAEWRQRRVAAWFTLVRRDDFIPEALPHALRTSLGSLTAPHLGFAVARRGDAGAVSALLDYQRLPIAARDGSGSMISALLEMLGEGPGLFHATDADRARVANMGRWADLIEAIE
jgi:hypothetical protein